MLAKAERLFYKADINFDSLSQFAVRPEVMVFRLSPGEGIAMPPRGPDPENPPPIGFFRPVHAGGSAPTPWAARDDAMSRMAPCANKGDSMTLGELGPGCRCRVRRLRARGVLCRRLMDLGFYPGVGVKVLRNAPLRDPVELEIDGYFLSIRRSEAHEVEVESHEA